MKPTEPTKPAVRRMMILALFVAALNLRPAINSIAPMLDTLRAAVDMNASVASLLTSIPVLCMGLFSPLAVKLSGKWGIERVVGRALLVIAVGTALRFFTPSATYLLMTAFVAGFGIAVAGPLLPAFIKRHFPAHVPALIAIYTVAMALGAALGSGLTGTLQDRTGSWRSALGAWAAIALFAALLWAVFVNRRRGGIGGGNRGDVSVAKAGLPWGNRKAWMLTLSFGTMSMLFYSFTAWLPQIVQGMGYSKTYAATALTVFVMVQIPVSLILPLLLRMIPSRRFWLLTESFIELAGLILLASSAFAPWFAALLIGIGAGGLFPLNLLLPLDATGDPQESASWSAMTQSAGYVIGATGPLLLGWIHDAAGSFSAAIVGLIFVNAAMIFVQLAATSMKKREPRTA